MGGRVRTGRASARLGLHHAALSFEKDQNTELSKYLLKRTALAALGLREGLSKQGRGAGRGTPRPWSPPPTRCRGGSEEEFSSVETGPGRTAMWERAAGPHTYLIPHVHAHRAGLARLLQALPAGRGGTSRAAWHSAHWGPQKEAA